MPNRLVRMVRWSCVDQPVPFHRGADQEFGAERDGQRPPEVEAARCCPARSARTARTIVMLLDSRQMVFRIGSVEDVARIRAGEALADVEEVGDDEDGEERGSRSGSGTAMPTRPRAERRDRRAAARATGVMLRCAHSYFQSGSSGCFRSHSGRRLRTTGIASKLYAGGGEVVAHSSVQASHGSSPAGCAVAQRHDDVPHEDAERRRPGRARRSTRAGSRVSQPRSGVVGVDAPRHAEHAGDVHRPKVRWKPMTKQPEVPACRAAR